MKNSYTEKDLQEFLFYINLKKRLGVILEIIEQRRKTNLSPFERKQINNRYQYASFLHDFMKNKISESCSQSKAFQDLRLLYLVKK